MTWSSENQRVLLKGFTYTDVTVLLTEDGLRLTSVSRPRYLDRLILWDTITQIETQVCDRNYKLREYWNLLVKLKDYTGLLPKFKYMIGLTFDDKSMMERNVHILLNVEEATFQAIQACLNQLDSDEQAPRYV